MPEYLAPGVFVEEIERGPKPIEGVATSTAAFVGETARGPLKPKFITAYNEYLRNYGDIYDPSKYMPYSVRAFFENGGRRCYVARVVGAGALASNFANGGFTVTAIGPGTWGDRLFVRIEPGTTKDNAGNAIGFRIRVFYWENPPPGFVPFDAAANPQSLPRPSQYSEDFDDISVDDSNPNYWDKRINNYNSALITIQLAPGTGIPGAVIAGQLGGGQPGAAPVLGDFQGNNTTTPPTGINAFELDQYRDVAVMHIPNPGAPALAVNQALITHCENQRFRFAVVDCDPNLALVANIDPRTTIADSSHAAFYYPWLEIADPRSGNRKRVPPGGAVCGIYSRNDNTRGVWKAPANETVANTIDLEFDINTGRQENLNPKGVNCIRRFPGRGIRVWGARTLASDPLWKYVNVRRLFIFLEASIYYNTQWVVFEPNDQRLWARLKQTITLFLRTQWREGALFGAKEEEAFSVTVGRETMTEDDILNGRLIIEVGIAPVRPAEFVIFRVFQKTQEASS